VSDTSDLAPAQGKPWCITFILQIFIYLNVVHLRCRNFMTPTCIYISTLSLTSTGLCSYFD
jgi:hypothetical protein